MFLVDKEIKELIQKDTLKILVDNATPPFDLSTQLGPSSIDLRLSRIIRKYKHQVREIDLTQAEETEIIEVPLNQEIVFQPGEIILGVTVEIICLPANMVGLIAARSSIARLGLIVVSQPFIHPGHSQSVALQLVNIINRPIKIKPLLPICQVMFLQSTSFAEKPYGSNNGGKYSHEVGSPLSSRIGVELGLEKSEQLVGPAEKILEIKFQELQNEIASLKNSTRSASTSNIPIDVKKDNSIDNPKRINLISTFFLMMLSGCFPLIVQTFNLQPFPSPILTISSMLAVFSIAALAILNWKR